MENKQMSANDMLNKMNMIKFGNVFKAAWGLVMKNPLMLLLVFVIPIVIAGILQQFIYPPIFGAAIGGGAIVELLLALIFLLLNAAISFFGLGALVRAAQQVNEGKPVNIGEIFNYVRDHFVDGVKLAIRLFFYTGAWIPVVYMLIMGGLTTLGLYSGKAGAAMLGLVGLLGLLFIFVIIAYIILFFKKIINSSFSYIYFFTSDHPEVEGSLQSSLKISENLTWTIFGNYFLMGLIGWLIALVLGIILAPIFVALGLVGRYGVEAGVYSTGYAGASLLSALIGSVVGVLIYSFQYKLKEQVEAFRSGKGEMHHEAPAHHEAPMHHEEHHAEHKHEEAAQEEHHHEHHESHEGHEGHSHEGHDEHNHESHE